VPAAQQGHWLGPLIKLGRLGLAQPSPTHTGWVGPSPKKKKKMNPAWVLSPAGPTCVIKGMFGKNTPLYLGHNFYAHSS